MITKEYIESQIDSGKTLMISTYLRGYKVNKKCLDKWRKSGHELFRTGDKSGFYMASGKSWMFILLSGCTVEFI